MITDDHACHHHTSIFTISETLKQCIFHASEESANMEAVVHLDRFGIDGCDSTNRPWFNEHPIVDANHSLGGVAFDALSKLQVHADHAIDQTDL
jgi:hypothetical protein